MIRFEAYIIQSQDSLSNQFMKFQLESTRIFDVVNIVGSIEEAETSFYEIKSFHLCCILKTPSLFISYNFNERIQTLLDLLHTKHNIRTIRVHETDAIIYTRNIQGTLMGDVYSLFYNSYDYEYPLCSFGMVREVYEPVAMNVFYKQYQYSMTYGIPNISYPVKEKLDNALFAYYKPFLIILHNPPFPEILRFFSEFNGGGGTQRYPHVRFIVYTKYKIDDYPIKNVLFLCNQKSNLENRFAAAQLSNKREILLFVLDWNIIPDLFYLNKLHRRQRAHTTLSHVSLFANDFVYSYPEHLRMDHENHHRDRDVYHIPNRHYLYREKPSLPALDPYFFRKDIENGLLYLQKLPTTYPYQLAKISFLTIQDDLKKLEEAIIQFLMLCKDDYETIKNLFLICLNLNIDEKIRKVIYIKYLEFQQETDPQKMLVLIKYLELNHIEETDARQILTVYQKLSLKPPDINKVFLTLFLKRLAYCFAETDLLQDLMTVVSKDFRMFETLHSPYHFYQSQHCLENYYPELILHLCDYVSQYMPSYQAIQSRRNQIESSLDILLNHWTKTYSLDTIQNIPFSNFQLSYHGLSSKTLFHKKSQLVRKLCPELNYVLTATTATSKTKVGFISSFLNRRHSVYKDRHMIIHKLSFIPEFEVYFFTLDDLDDSVKHTFGKAIHVKLPPNLSDMRKTIESYHFDFLVYCEIGMQPLFYYLAHMRLATYQCNTWGHSDTSGIDTIDYFISSKYFDTEKTARDNYTENVILMDSLSTYYINPLRSYRIQEFKDRRAFGYSPKNHLYICPQSLFKLHPDFDSYLTDILRRDPDGIVVLMDFLQKKQIILQRLENICSSSLLSRIHFVGSMPHREYLNFIQICDVMLDTYPFGGCNSSLEAFSLHKMVVTQKSSLINGSFTAGFLQKMDLSEWICKSKKQYVDLAVRLGTNPLFRQEIEHKISQKHCLLFEEEQSFVDWFNFLSKKKSFV